MTSRDLACPKAKLLLEQLAHEPRVGDADRAVLHKYAAGFAWRLHEIAAFGVEAEVGSDGTPAAMHVGRSSLLRRLWARDMAHGTRHTVYAQPHITAHGACFLRRLTSNAHDDDAEPPGALVRNG